MVVLFILSVPVASWMCPHSTSLGFVFSMNFLTLTLPACSPVNVRSTFVFLGGECETRTIWCLVWQELKPCSKMWAISVSVSSKGVSKGVGEEPPMPRKLMLSICLHSPWIDSIVSIFSSVSVGGSQFPGTNNTRHCAVNKGESSSLACCRDPKCVMSPHTTTKSARLCLAFRAVFRKASALP